MEGRSIVGEEDVMVLVLMGEPFFAYSYYVPCTTAPLAPAKIQIDSPPF
jgi:hypothetical protein